MTDTFTRGGNVVVPTFALERAQELLYFLSQGIDHGRLTKSTQVFVDFPMAISATEIMRRHLDGLRPEIAKLIRDGNDPFHFPGLHFTRESAESVAINNIHGGAIIMAGSGMCTGGRVRHHLQHNLRSPGFLSVVFVGYAAAGTLARHIIDGAKEAEIFGERFPVRARIYTINGFSAHADQADRWLGKSKPVRKGRSSFTAKKKRCEASRHISATPESIYRSPIQAFEL